MDFQNTATTVLRSFDEKGLHDAFIGGLALSAWGVFRATRRRLPGLGEFPVCLPEDLIGLKLQVLRNDPRRQDQEHADIEALLVAGKEENRPIDWAILENYGVILGLAPTIEGLRKNHG